MTGIFRDFFPRAETSAPAWVLFIPAEHPRAGQGSPKVCFILAASSRCSPKRSQSRITAHIPPVPPLLGEKPKCSHPALSGNFPGGNKGIVRSHCCPGRPFHAPVLGGHKSPAGNEILFQKDLGFSHDPGMKVWAGFRHESRNSRNPCAAFFGTGGEEILGGFFRL